MAKKMKTKDANDVKIEKNVLVLGDQESMSMYDSAKESGGMAFLRLNYNDPINIFVFVSAQFVGISEHFLKIGEETHRIVCPVQSTDDFQLIANKWGYPQGCPICAMKKQMYDNSPKDSTDPLDQAKRKAAYILNSKLNYYMYAIKGEGDVRRVGGKRLISPYFEDVSEKNIKILNISRDAFDKMVAVFNELDLASTDVPGLPVNFIGGKGTGSFSAIQEVVFYPKNKVPGLLKVTPNFSKMVEVNLNDVENVLDKWVDEELPLLLSGRTTTKKSKSKSKTTTKKSKR